MVSTCGEQFGQNGQKLHENYKINILGSKQTGGVGGQAPVGEILLRELFLSITILSLQEAIRRSQPQSLLTC